MPFGGRTEADQELFETSAENLEELVRGEVFEDQSVVELIDSAVRELLGHVFVRSVQLGEAAEANAP